jgi:hypothetical protein
VAVPVCLDSVPASFDGVGGCLARGSSSVDANLLRLGAELNWRWTRGFATFLSFDFRDQETDGLLGGRDRNTSRVRLGFRYAYDYEVF